MFDHLPAEVRKKIQFMMTIPFFQEFTPSDLSETALMSVWLKFAAGTIIIQEGEIGSSFWIILRGSVKVVKRVLNNPEGILLSVIPCGECFGEMSMISGQPRTADIMANEDVMLFKIDDHGLKKAREGLQLKFFKRFSQILVNRLTQTMATLSQLQQAPKPPKAPSSGESKYYPKAKDDKISQPF